jgi:arginase
MRAATDRTTRRPSTVAIGVSSGAGAHDPGCKDGPAAFRRHWDRSPYAQKQQLIWENLPETLVDDAAPLDTVARVTRWLAAAAERVTGSGDRLLVIGGDHSCSIGTWNGVARVTHHAGALGLIWIDAHMDMHVPATTHTGAIHGMPVAVLLGYGAPELTGLAAGRPPLAPEHVCLVGARSFEPEEVEFARRHKVRVIGMDEVSRRGIDDCLAEARDIAGRASAGYGVSLDLDVFDPADAPGVGTPVAGGIRADGFFDAWSDLTHDPACRGVEVVEYNPHHDRAARTAQLMGALVSSATRAESLRWVG